jgi:hypothetical protein
MSSQSRGCTGGGGLCLHFICLLFRWCSISILVVFPISKLLKGNILHACVFVIVLLGPYFRCKQLQENQADAWFLKAKEKKPWPKQETLVFLATTVHTVTSRNIRQQKPNEKPERNPENQVLYWPKQGL